MRIPPNLRLYGMVIAEMVVIKKPVIVMALGFILIFFATGNRGLSRKWLNLALSIIYPVRKPPFLPVGRQV